MKLNEQECRHRLAAADHGVLVTLHPERGADAVPVCFAVEGSRLAVPIDGVKPKSTADLQRVRNLDRDPRATLLVEQWDNDDWGRLWWVRATLSFAAAPVDASDLERRLAAKYRPYADRPFARLLVFDIAALTGWTAGT